MAKEILLLGIHGGKRMSGDDNNDAAYEMNQRLDNQQKKADMEVENTRKSLERTRLDIIKASTGQQFTNPDDPKFRNSQSNI